MDFDPNFILDQMEEQMQGGNIYLPYEARQATGCVPERPQLYQYRSAQPSPLSSSRRGTSDVSPMIAISASIQRTNSSSNRRNTFQLQDDFHAFPDDVEMRRVISPHVDEDVSYVQKRFSFSEIPDSDSLLNHESQPYVLDVLERNRNNTSSPWNALGTEGLYGGSYQYQDDSFLTIPGYSQSQTMDDGLSPAASTTGWISDSFGAMSPDNVGMRHETRPRGGRQPGSNLPEESVDNVRKVRRIGACLRCAALKERCSPGMPCSSCANNDGRKWDGCVRSFTSLVDIFKPESEAITRFMIDHTYSRPQRIDFDLPLDFGFGKDFHGFKGAEYDPITVETQYSHAVGHTEQHPESPLYGYSIQVYPTNSDSPEVMELVYEWLKETLTSARSMEGWLRICFHGEDVEWIRRLLHMAWQYSVQSWDEQNHHQIDEPQLDKDLLSAWMVALLTTMLSLPITIARSARRDVLNKLQSARPNYEYSYSSRPINKCVKSLFFEIYKRLIKKVMLALEAFRKKAPKDISERHLGHVHCMAILVVVVTWQLQTSLMDNYRLSAQDNPATDLDETFYHIREVEKAFKNTVLYVRHKNRDWFKKHLELPRNGSRDDEIQVITPRLQGIINIKLDYSEEISRHRTAKLESVMDVNLPFNHLNMQRVFAFYFDPMPATR